MGLPTSKKHAGLGHAIANRRAKEALTRNGSNFHTTDFDRGLQSVTHQGDLEEFLSTAQLADSDFTAERRNVSIVNAPGSSAGPPRRGFNPFLLSGQEEQEVLRRQGQNKQRLRVPRRPHWDSTTTPAQLQRLEADSFLEWRRSLAQLTESQSFILTPFERNLEVWRQLWRVVERSHLVVQIVDARNPLRFRCEDLERYVRDVDVRPGEFTEKEGQGPRRNLLLINKADLLDEGQRKEWARYFEEKGIAYAFFSAANAAAIQLERAEREAAEERAAELAAARAAAAAREDGSDEDSEEDDDDSDDAGSEDGDGIAELSRATEQAQINVPKKTAELVQQAASSAAQPQAAPAADPKDPTRVLNVLELEELFMKSAPPLSDFEQEGHAAPTRLCVGLVGYPNVGKSSTINALLGEKKVSVSSTPGHTKHFQTINLSPETVLCDCPGLVFPQFATSAAELVCDGVLPIDQMREYTAPAELIARRIPRDILEGTYGIRIDMQLEEEGGSGTPTGLEVLTSYAVARGFTRQGQGNPDESRSARYVFKDYVSARLLYAHPPPGVDADKFNADQRNAARAALAGRRYAPLLAEEEEARAAAAAKAAKLAPRPQGAKSKAIDSSFFEQDAASRPAVKGRSGNAMASLRNRLNPDGTPLSKEQVAELMAAEAALASKNGKKHNKSSRRRVKQRSGQGFA